MDDLTTALADARHTIDPAWDPARARRARDVFHARLKRRRTARIAAVVATPLIVALLALGAHTLRPSPHTDVASRGEAPATHPDARRAHTTGDGPFRFWDGSTATPLAQSELRAVEVSPSRIVVDVASGEGRFDVTPGRADRAFVVRSGEVTVRVIGTAFTVGVEASRTRVTVEHGRVSVEWRGGRATLVDGESGLFPPAAGDVVAPEPVEQAPSPEHSASASAVGATERADRNWRRLAESGDFGEAFEALQAVEVRDRPEELLLAADAARLSGHPREALTYYQRVVRDHAGDPRAPLAAFTMGRVLLTQLGRPRDAAGAFARARALAGGGSIAEDALAREVEARSVAGETERARSLAEEYVARYPAGQRIRAVRRFGALP